MNKLLQHFSYRLWPAIAVLLLGLPWNAAHAQGPARKLKSSIQPEYPELAKRNNIRGTARVQLLIATNGKVKHVKVLGGNAVLAQAAVDAVMKWKYEPASAETTLVVKFDFDPLAPPNHN
ncbi:MAG TPA: energy transducer TonB [Candidatus Limnocylindrales bacterium]|nr:energy transducer TonB [Candidatus Limnocylindrales bacterium]